MIALFFQAVYFTFQAVFYSTILFVSLWVLWTTLPRGKIGDYHKRYVLITGCDSGFGKETAIRLDKMGFHVFATCLTREGEEGLEAVCSERVKTLHLDLTSSDTIQETYKKVKTMLPSGTGLWGLVNNAAILIWAPIEWQPLDTFKRTADVNLWGMIDVTKTFLPLVKLAKGRVVTFSSPAGRIASPNYCSYSVTKYGIEAFSDALRREMQPWGVKVAIMEPGGFATKIATPARVELNLKTLWEGLSEDQKREYGDNSVERHLAFLKQHQSRISPHIYKVAEAVVDALTSRNPNTRYAIGLDMKLVILIGSLPTFLGDAISDFRWRSIFPKVSR